VLAPLALLRQFIAIFISTNILEEFFLKMQTILFAADI
jgi:hypothetical protein